MAAIASTSSRRSACDRCKGHKLRCLREAPDQERCDRCSRAQVECLTTPTFIVRNLSRTDYKDGTRKRRRSNSHGIIQPDPPDLFVNNNGTDLPATDDILHNNIFATSGSTTNTITITPALDMTAGIEYSLYDSIFEGDLDNIITSLDHVSSVSYPGFDSPLQSALCSSRNKLPSDILSSNLFEQPASPIDALSRASASVISAETTTCRSQANVHSPGKGGPSAKTTTTQTHSRRFSDLNLYFETLLGRIDQGPSTMSLDILISVPEETGASETCLVDEILSGTREFIDLLERLRPATSPRADSSPPLSSNESSRRFSGFMVVEPRGDVTNMSSMQHAPNPTLADDDTASPIETTEAHLDVTVLLLILSCYVNVLRIYVILFAYIHQFLLEISESDNPVLCPVPGLGFGKFLLQSGNLQATMFIQITTSLLERVESLLGLPRELRINMRGDRQDGILRLGDLKTMVKIVLAKEGSGQPENGKGGVASLREHLKQSRQLLQERIAP